MLSVTVLLLLVAFITAIASALGKCPVWIPVVLVIVVLLLTVLPR